MGEIVTFGPPVELLTALVGALLGGVVGLGLVYLVDWLWRPRATYLGFARTPVNFGILHKARFRLRGKQNPGLCGLHIEWCDRNVLGKWDETPYPVEDDDLADVRPELVPATFSQPLFTDRDCLIPVVIESDGRYEIFSGWWFGKQKGYRHDDPPIEKDTRINLTLTGAGLNSSKTFTLRDLC